MAPPAGQPEAGKNTQRRDDLVNIQAKAQERWAAAKVFESDAPATGEGTPDEKFFGNFPYPYMNGVLHLGHAFSLSKLEFASAYHRLCGKNVLFPQGFHCTGMPIKACADRLDRELATYGCPPNFEKDEEPEPAAEAPAEAEASGGDPTKFKAQKSKAAAKQGTASTQYGILKMSNIPEEEIPKFRDSKHWLYYFPPLAQRDITLMGCGVDWRRSFITTEENPYYDAFVRWQFWTLKKRGLVVKDKRFAVYSPLDGQPCADHDRASGEGVGPQEYSLIKMDCLELNGALKPLEGKGKVVFLAATLRPETMYGQTNAWVLPSGEYGAYRGLDGEVYVMGEHAARNMAYQEVLPKHGEPELLLQLTGQDLIGVPLRSPNAVHERIYILPLLTISMKKGTGVVTSVPSDAPADYRALMDLKEKAPLREKFGVQDDWVMPFEVIPIINIPEFGDTSAVTVCEQLKIKSQNDKVKLEEAKRLTYLKGFTDGVMLVGPHKGKKVSEVKTVIRDEMKAAKQIIVYCEPESLVMSRSGDECVVALTDQWYLLYGAEQWRAATQACLAQMDTFMPEARNSFEHTLGWLNQWACSRSFGLGTKLPWDPDFLIESLSDSTIYMAYYTIAHILQEGDIYGKKAGAIPAEAVTNEVLDYIYLGGKLPEGCKIPRDLMQRMRREFEYWYPFDLRVSGKDLIQNHLTFALYNHTAIWMQGKWPRGMRCNGHLLLNAEKMSKSKGNFMTLNDACKEYSSDAMRVGLADAGDGLDDANFDQKSANAAILRLTKEIAWIEELLAAAPGMRKGEATTFADRTFTNAISICVHRAKAAYDSYKFKDALKTGWFDLQNARDVYRFACGEEGMNIDILMLYIDVEARVLAPIAPHTCDHMWSNLLKKDGCVLTAGWPEVAEPDFAQEMAASYLEALVPTLRKRIAKAEAPPKKKKGGDEPAVLKKVAGIDIGVAPCFEGWRAATLEILAKNFDEAARAFPADIFKKLLEEVKASPSVEGMSDKALKQTVMPFAKFMIDKGVTGGAMALAPKLPFDEAALLVDNMQYLVRSLELSAIKVHADPAAAPEGLDMQAAYPGEPAVNLVLEPAA